MTNIIKKQNGHQPATFGSVVDQIFQNNLSRFFDDSFWGSNGFTSTAKPPVNIRETESAYLIEMSAPGLQKQDFQLNISERLLTISYDPKKDEQQAPGSEEWLRREFEKGPFNRTFTLDDSVDIEKIQARYENGILYLELPKSDKSRERSRTITIQ